MFDNILNLFKKKGNKEENKNTAKERLHLVLMQDRANVSADFLDLMKQEIIEVIKKYIEVDEDQIDVKLTNKLNGDGTTGAPALYANIPIKSIKKETRINSNKDRDELNDNKKDEKTEIVNQNTAVLIEPENSNDSEIKNSENSNTVIEENKTEDIEKNNVEIESSETNIEENNIEENNSEENADNTNNEKEVNIEEKSESEKKEESEGDSETTNNTNESDNSKKQENGNNKKKKKENNKTTFFDNIKVEESKTDNKTDEE